MQLFLLYISKLHDDNMIGQNTSILAVPNLIDWIKTLEPLNSWQKMVVIGLTQHAAECWQTCTHPEAQQPPSQCKKQAREEGTCQEVIVIEWQTLTRRDPSSFSLNNFLHTAFCCDTIVQMEAIFQCMGMFECYSITTFTYYDCYNTFDV